MKDPIARLDIKRRWRLLTEPLKLGLSHPNIGTEMGERSTRTKTLPAAVRKRFQRARLLGVIRQMSFEEFLKSNYWKIYILGKSFDGVRCELGEPTDEGVGKLKRSLKKFGDVEVGFNEEGLACYCQIDFNPNHPMTCTVPNGHF